MTMLSDYLTFSRALPIFTIIFVIIFFTLIRYSEKLKDYNQLSIPGSLRMLFHNLTITVLYVSIVLGIIATMIIETFKYSMFYMILLNIPPIVLLTSIFYKHTHKLLLPMIIMWHFMLIATAIPKSLIFVSEGSHMTRTLIQYGRWIPELAHNPSYNPFPTMAFISASISLLTGLPWYNFYTSLAILLSILISFDIAMYLIASVIASRLRWRNNMESDIGLLAIFLGALTPYLFVSGHAFQVPANALWILSVYFMIRNNTSTTKKIFLVTSVILGVASILTHVTSYLVITLLIVILLLMYFEKLLKINTQSRGHELSSYLAILSIFIVAGFLKVVYDATQLRYVGNLAISAVENFINRIFALEMNSKISYTLYDYGGIPFYQTIIWVLTPSLAIALILYLITRKQYDYIIYAFFLTASISIISGYFYAVISKTSTQLYRGQYVAFSLLVPLASVAFKNLLSSKSKVLFTMLCFLILLVIILVPNDPELGVGYFKARGIPLEVSRNQPSSYDIIKADLLIALIQRVDTINEFKIYSNDQILFYRLSTYGGQRLQTYSKFGEALYETMYIHGYTLKDSPIIPITYISYDEFSDFVSKNDIIYNTGDALVSITIYQ